MILSYRDLCVENNKNIVENTIEESGSLLVYSLSCISESDRLVREMMEDVFNSSSNNNPIIAFNESFDFGNIVKSIIDFFIESIKKIYRSFKGLLSKIFGGDKILNKYKSQLLNYNHTLKVYFDHYNYTNLDVDIPPSSLISIFQEEYDTLYESLEKITGIKEKAVIISKLNELSDSISKDDDSYFNKLRRNIMSSSYKGNKAAITEGDFIRELKLLFRNNMEKPSKEDIPSYEVRKSAEIFFNGKSLENNIKQQSKRIEKSSYELKQKLEKISPSNFMKEYQPIDYDIEFALNRLLKLKSDRMSKACNIIVIAYSEKLQSVKDAVVQYRRVLHEAVKELIKEGK